MHRLKEFWKKRKLVSYRKNRSLDMAAGTKFKNNMYPRQEMEECEKMVSVNSVTKMLTKERKYSDRGSPWIYQLIYHSRTRCKRGSVKIKDNSLIK